MNIGVLMERFLHETFHLFVEMSPYLLMGFFFAGLLHVFMGEKYIRKHFSGSGWRSVVKAALFGVPLPVCSCGVIPLAEAIRRDGASKSATMSFLVSTPSSGVDSIMATYALMGPAMAVFRPFASFFSGILVGGFTLIQERREPQITQIQDNLSPAAKAVNNSSSSSAENNAGKKANGKFSRRAVKEIFIYGFRVIPGEIARWLVVGVILGGAISAFLPQDFGFRYLSSPVMNYLAILLISIPLYVCATGSIPIAASLMAKGVLPGAALAFLIAGPATNTVTISFIFKRMGAKIALIYVFSIAITAVGAGLIFDVLLRSFGVSAMEMVTHEHAAHWFQMIKYVSAAVLALVFITGKVDFSRVIAKFRKRSVESMIRQTMTINVPDMNCQHCKMKISQALGSMPEIKTFSVDLDARAVIVETELERSFIVERIKAEGYHPVE